MASRRRFAWSVAITPVVVVALLIAIWAIDTSMSSGEVPRNTELAGMEVGGLTEAELMARAASLADAYSDTPVVIESAGETYESTAGALGLSIDEDATIAATLAVADERALPVRPFAWLGSVVTPREVDPGFAIDAGATTTELARLEGDRRTPPVEPDVVYFLEDIVATPGEPGNGIEADRLARLLLEKARSSGIGPLSVAVEPTVIAPTIDDAEAEALAAQASELTSDPITLAVGGEEVVIEPATQRSWITSSVEDSTLTTNFDVERIRETLKERLSASAESPIDASFTIEGGKPVVVPGRIGKACCAPDAGEKVLAALEAGDDVVELELVETEPDLTTEEAEALGITTEIGSPDAFGPTTRYACCQSRVTNIHRIADIVRGAVIRPGETFSVNDFVGERTREKGFVPAGVIYNGEFTDDVGGGVSQFATTLFNAALFAGLDFGEYQSHSIYISRYPRGHEATISYPAPDLEIVNNTPYGVLLWPEYTASSLTVRIYSTPHAQVQLGEPNSSPSGRCTSVTTPRTRTYPDGSVENDSVFARYRPGEGVDC